MGSYPTLTNANPIELVQKSRLKSVHFYQCLHIKHRPSKNLAVEIIRHVDSLRQQFIRCLRGKNVPGSLASSGPLAP